MYIVERHQDVATIGTLVRSNLKTTAPFVVEIGNNSTLIEYLRNLEDKWAKIVLAYVDRENEIFIKRKFEECKIDDSRSIKSQSQTKDTRFMSKISKVNLFESDVERDGKRMEVELIRLSVFFKFFIIIE